MSISTNSTIIKKDSVLESKFSKIKKIIEKEENLTNFAKKQINLSINKSNKEFINLDEL